MFGYIMTIIVTIFIVSIISEHMVINRLQMSPGVETINGRCRLKEGYGKMQPEASHMRTSGFPQMDYDTGLMNVNEVHNDWYRPFVR